MRKLTPEERAAKKALAHTHDENCGHTEAPAVAPVAEEAPVEEAPVAEVVAEAPAQEGPTGPFKDELSPDKGFAEAPAEKPKKKTAPKD